MKNSPCSLQKFVLSLQVMFMHGLSMHLLPGNNHWCNYLQLCNQMINPVWHHLNHHNSNGNVSTPSYTLYCYNYICYICAQTSYKYLMQGNSTCCAVSGVNQVKIFLSVFCNIVISIRLTFAYDVCGSPLGMGVFLLVLSQAVFWLPDQLGCGQLY